MSAGSGNQVSHDDAADAIDMVLLEDGGIARVRVRDDHVHIPVYDTPGSAKPERTLTVTSTPRHPGQHPHPNPAGRPVRDQPSPGLQHQTRQKLSRAVSDPELWAELTDWPGYQVSSHGRVYSMQRVTIDKNGRRSTVPGKMLKPTLSRQHLTVSLRRDGKTWTRSIHRLVLAAFVGPPPKRMQVRHHNKIGTDNRLSNLEYATPSKICRGTNRNSKKTHCIRGHEFTPENTRRDPNGGRHCWTCDRERTRKQRRGRQTREGFLRRRQLEHR
jgi:hypothetical protein